MSVFFMSMFRWLVDNIWNIFVDAFNFTIELFAVAALALLDVLPDRSNVLPDLPYAPSSTLFDFFVSCLNWIFPMQFLAGCVTFIVSSLFAYVSIVPLARWLKLLR